LSDSESEGEGVQDILGGNESKSAFQKRQERVSIENVRERANSTCHWMALF
jgi:hypothetical protein